MKIKSLLCKILITVYGDPLNIRGLLIEAHLVGFIVNNDQIVVSVSI